MAGGGGTTTHQININVNAGPLQQLQQAANQAAQAVAGIGKGVNFSGIVSGAQGAYGAISGIVQQAFDAARALADMAKEGAKLQTLENAFNALGGSAAELQKLKDLTGGLVSDEDLQQASNLAKLFKLPEQEIPKLIKLAQGASAALGTTTAKAISDTFTAASRQSKMIADNMGIVIGDMGVMYENYAKKHGKTVDQLTDKDKQLAFVQKMIAEGGKQMELATLAQGNAAMKAEAQMANFEAGLKKAANEAFASFGAYDAMGGVLSRLQIAFTQNADQLQALVMPAFMAVTDLIVPLVTVLGSLMPLLEPIGKLFQLLGAALTAVAPIIGIAAQSVAFLVSMVIDLVTLALEPLFRALSAAAEALGMDGLAASLEEAAQKMNDARTMIDGNNEGLIAQKDAVDNLAASWGALDEARSYALKRATMGMSAEQIQASDNAFAASLGVTPEQLAQVQGNMEAFKRTHLEWVAYQASSFKQSEIAKMNDAELQQVIADSGKTRDELQKIAENSLAMHGKNLAEKLGMSAKHGDAMASLIQREISKETKAKKDAAAQEYKTSADALAAMDQLIIDTADANVSLLSGRVWETAKNEKEALDAIDKYYDEHLAHIYKVYGEGSDLANEKEAQLNKLVEEATAAAGTKGKGRGGGKAPDWFKAEWDARLSLMDEYSRQSSEIETRYQDQMSSLHADQTQLRIDLTMKMVDELDALERQQAEKVKADDAALKDYLIGSESGFHQRMNQIRLDAEAMRASARGMGAGADVMAGIDIAEMRATEAALADIAANSPMWTTLTDMRTSITDGIVGGFAATGDAMADMTARMDEETKRAAAMFQSMGSSIGNTMVSIAASGEGAREQIFKSMGSMFGQLSSAFLAWATAEGSLLAGNPFAAAAAAITLGMVASAISAFGSRGKTSGAKGSTSSAMSRQSLESRRDEQPPQTIINNYGFATPDDIARAVSRGEMRGRDLRGRERV